MPAIIIVIATNSLKIKCMNYIKLEDVKVDNIFVFEFTDSIYAFDEDLVETIETYNSLVEVSSADIKGILFILHCKIMSLICEDDKNENYIEKYKLTDYGNGPNYENESYYHILNGEYNVTKITDNNVLLTHLESGIIIKISKTDLEYLQNKKVTISSDILIDDNLENYVCINKNNRSNLQKKLLQDVENLNSLLNEINKSNNIISIINKS